MIFVTLSLSPDIFHVIHGRASMPVILSITFKLVLYADLRMFNFQNYPNYCDNATNSKSGIVSGMTVVGVCCPFVNSFTRSER